VLTGSGSSFTGSDHYPIFGDYNILVPPPATPATPVLSSPGFGTNGYFQFKVSSSSNTTFQILASTNLTVWSAIGSGVTGTNGLLLFQDTNTPAFQRRYYRASWSAP
jgi:hypothetical protein